MIIKELSLIQLTDALLQEGIKPFSSSINGAG